jgi:hypothetical protein
MTGYIELRSCSWNGEKQNPDAADRRISIINDWGRVDESRVESGVRGPSGIAKIELSGPHEGRTWVRRILSPLWGFSPFRNPPTAYAVGYTLTPLRGWKVTRFAAGNLRRSAAEDRDVGSSFSSNSRSPQA